MTVSREQVTEALREVFDPELGLSVVDLGLIYGVEIDAGWCCAEDDGNGLWFSDNWPAARFFAAWRDMAARYASNPLVAAMDIMNEPRRSRVGGCVVTPTWGTGSATDIADLLVRRGMPFREAHGAVVTPVRDKDRLHATRLGFVHPKSGKTTRFESAVTRAKAREIMNGNRTEDAFSKFDILERRADFAEGRADALGMTGPKSLEEEIAELKASDSVDAELEAMKAALKAKGK